MINIELLNHSKLSTNKHKNTVYGVETTKNITTTTILYFQLVVIDIEYTIILQNHEKERLQRVQSS